MKKNTRDARRTAPRLDAANIAGLSSLMNTQNLRSGINTRVIEERIMGKQGDPRPGDTDHIKLFEEEINRISAELGFSVRDDAAAEMPARSEKKSSQPFARTIQVQPEQKRTRLIEQIDLDDGEEKKSVAGGAAGATSEGAGAASEGAGSSSEESGEDSEDSEDSDSDSDNGGGEAGGEAAQVGHRQTKNSRPEHKTDAGTGDVDDVGDNVGDNVDDIIAQFESDLGLPSSGGLRRPHVEPFPAPLGERNRSAPTEDQERRNQLTSIVRDLRGETRTATSQEQEHVQNIKASKLQQIGQLRDALTEESVDISGIEVVTMTSPMEKIDSTLNALRLRNDSNRYSTIAEEAILGGAEMIETVFDGSRAIPFVGWTPDFTGYHNLVNMKLHRMRFETSQIVGGVIQKYNIGPGARIALELLPSLILYPRQQKKHRVAPGLYNDPHLMSARSAVASIHDSDNRSRQETQAIENI